MRTGRYRRLAWQGTAALCIAILGGCDTEGLGSDATGDGGTGPAATHHGVAAWTSGSRGVLALTLGDDASGVVVPDKGGALELSGAASGGAVTLAGGGLSIEGAVESGAARGDLSGTGGAGVFAAVEGARGAVRLFCGAFSGDLTGVFSLAVADDGTSAAAIASRDASWVDTAAGTLSGKTLTLAVDGAKVTGLCSTSTCSGSWSRGSAIGTWESTLDGCPELP